MAITEKQLIKIERDKFEKMVLKFWADRFDAPSPMLKRHERERMKAKLELIKHFRDLFEHSFNVFDISRCMDGVLFCHFGYRRTKAKLDNYNHLILELENYRRLEGTQHCVEVLQRFVKPLDVALKRWKGTGTKPHTHDTNNLINHILHILLKGSEQLKLEGRLPNAYGQTKAAGIVSDLLNDIGLKKGSETLLKNYSKWLKKNPVKQHLPDPLLYVRILPQKSA